MDMTKIIKYSCFSFFVILILSSGLKAQEENVNVSLTDDSQLTIEGPHRFVEIAGISGLQVTSLKTKAFVKTTALNSAQGSVSFWMSPMEDMDKSHAVGSSEDGMKYAFLADRFSLYKTNLESILDGRWSVPLEFMVNGPCSVSCTGMNDGHMDHRL